VPGARKLAKLKDQVAAHADFKAVKRALHKMPTNCTPTTRPPWTALLGQNPVLAKLYAMRLELAALWTVHRHQRATAQGFAGLVRACRSQRHPRAGRVFPAPAQLRPGAGGCRLAAAPQNKKASHREAFYWIRNSYLIFVSL